MDSLGLFVCKRRKTLGLRQQDLADQLGYTVQAVSKFENGQSSMDVASLPGLAKALSLSLEDLLHEKDEVSRPCNVVFSAETIAHNLAYLRAKKNQTQKEVGDVIGVSARTLANYEKGNSLPSLDTILAFLKFYGVSADDFFGKDLSPAPLVHPKKRHLGLWIALALILSGGVAVAASTPLWARRSSGFSSSSVSSSDSSLGVSSPSSSLPDASSSASSASSSSSVVSDPVAYFPGLQSFALLVNGDASQSLSPGSYSVTIATDPADYFRANAMPFGWSFDETVTGITVDAPEDPYANRILTIAANAVHGTAFAITGTATYQGHTCSAVFNLSVINPTGEISPLYFPGLTAFYATCNGASTLENAKPGQYDFLVHYEGSLGFDVTNDCYVAMQISFPGVAGGEYRSVNLTIPSDTPDGFVISTDIYMGKKNNTQTEIHASPVLSFKVSNPGVI